MPAALTWFDGLSRVNGASTLYGRGGRLGLAGPPVITLSNYGIDGVTSGAYHWALNNNPRNSLIMAFCGNPAGIGNYNFIVGVSNLGFVQIYDANGAIVDTSVLAIPNVVAYRGWEVRYVIDNAVGEVMVRIYDGSGPVDYINVSGIDTRHGAAPAAKTWNMQGLSGGTFGDAYGHDGTDWWPTDDGCDFLPLEAITEDDGVPAGTGSPATTLDALVDINTPGGTFPFHDGDVTYSKIDASGLPKRVVGEVTLPSDVDIRAVQPIATTRKTDAGVCQHTLLLQSPSAGTEDDNAGELFAAETTYFARSRMYVEDPDDPGNPFTPGATVAVGIERVN